jgi:hypothetical protein
MAAQVSKRVEEMDLGTLIILAEERAIVNQGGHLTLLRFTTGWKCMFGTPDLRGGDGGEEVGRLRSFPTPREAVYDLLFGGPI